MKMQRDVISKVGFGPSVLIFGVLTFSVAPALARAQTPAFFSAVAEAGTQATLQYTLTVQKCAEALPGALTCASGEVGAQVQLLHVDGSAQDATLQGTFAYPKIPGGVTVDVAGALRSEIRQDEPVACLSGLRLHVVGLPEAQALTLREVCVPLAGGGGFEPLFLFGSWHLEGDRKETTYAVSLSGSLSTGPLP